MCVKPKKSNVSGLPRPRCCSVLGGEPAELDEPRLVGMQLQVELRESLAKVAEELLCITLMLEPDDEVIREARDDHVTACVASPPLPDPPVQDVMEVHVGEQRRSRCSLRCPFRSSPTSSRPR